MASKKSFQQETPKGSVYDSLIDPEMEDITAEEPATDEAEQELKAARESLHTQGKKGMKALRINMAFTPSNIDYIRMLQASFALKGERKTMTQIVNEIIERNIQEHGNDGLLQQIQALQKQLK